LERPGATRSTPRRAEHPLRQTPDVKRGKDQPPTCEHGAWRFAGADYKRHATKWRCPTDERTPASRWIKAGRLHPLIPRETPRFRSLTSGAAPSSGSSAG